MLWVRYYILYTHVVFLLTLLLLGDDLATVVVISLIGSHSSSVE